MNIKYGESYDTVTAYNIVSKYMQNQRAINLAEMVEELVAEGQVALEGDQDEMSIVWCVEDVKSLDEDLTDEQCREVLERAKRDHDATIGINWDVLQYHIDELKGEQ